MVDRRALPAALQGAAASLVAATAFVLASSIVGGVSFFDPALQYVFWVGAVILWPFTTLGFYTARAWVGVHPTPLLAALRDRALLPHRALIIPAVAVGAAALVFALSIPAVLFLDPTIETPEEHPFAELAGPDLLAANLTIFAEEIIFRLAILFPLIAALGVRGADRAAKPSWRVWVAIVLAGVLFGLAHAPDYELLGAPFLDYLVFVVVQKGLLAGTVFGYVAWRWGLEAAILTHYFTNVFFFLPSVLFP